MRTQNEIERWGGKNRIFCWQDGVDGDLRLGTE
jgi:hypothetical protein